MSFVLIPPFNPDVKQFCQIAEKNEVPAELAPQFASFGFKATEDGRAAYCHETTKAPAFARSCYKCMTLTHGMNMDSGGVIRRPDGRQAGCVLDGVSGSGLTSWITAHLGAKKILEILEKQQGTCPANVSAYCLETILKPAAMSMSREIKEGSNYLFGETTVGFMDTFPVEGHDRYRVVACAIGDVYFMHFSQRTKEVTAPLPPLIKKASDPGGVIDTDGVVKGTPRVAEFELDADDILLLVTDGVTESFRPLAIHAAVQVVIQNPFFDQEYEQLIRFERPWENRRITAPPIRVELETFVRANCGEGYQEDNSPTAAKAAKRLSNCVRMINHRTFEYDKLLYALEKDPTKQKEYQEAKAKEPSLVGNPDDCMVVAFTPCALFS